MTENPLDTQSRAASSTPDVRTFGWKKTLLYSLLPTVVLLCFLEVAASLLEIWIPSWKVDYGWGFDSASKVFVPGKTPGIRITDPNKVVSFSPDEFKMPKPYGVYRIFMLGGSSVNYLHNHLRRFMASLNQRFAGKPMIEIIDVGGCAYGSHRLVAVLTEILDYQPDLILFHEANNEFEEREQLQLAQIERLALQKIVYKSALCRFIRDRIASFQVSQLQREKNRDILANKPLTVYDGYRRYDKAGIEERMRAFENNLRIMANLCQEAHVRFIISTVPSNLWEPHLATEAMKSEVQALYARQEYEAGAKLVRQYLSNNVRHQASDTENRIIRKVAQEHDIPLVDVESAIVDAEPHHVPGEALFTDHCHLNSEGDDVLIACYQEKILEVMKEQGYLPMK